MKKICAITMARNDEFFLNRWIKYYGNELGEENLYVYLDGTDQPAPAEAGKANIIHCERVVEHVVAAEKRRLSFLSEVARELLKTYDIVIGVDADEFLVVDPHCKKTLVQYLSAINIKHSVSGLGIDVGQHLNKETTLNYEKPFLQQRNYAYLSSRYTKPSVISEPVQWGSGFHRVKGHNFHIDPNLYLFHFGSVDMEMIKMRLQDKDRMSTGREKHIKKRARTIFLITRKKALESEVWLEFARILQTVVRPVYALNKPSMCGLKLIVKIPKQFKKIIQHLIMTNEPIDIVISWVDGNDQIHKQKMNPYLSSKLRKSDDIAGPTRYCSVGEIFYCVSSIFRFAPFVRKIFIVTDDQNPNLDAFIKLNFPEKNIPIEIIDHRVIFREYEEYLPVFNSRAVETCIHRIPDLSENYVYLNDDFFLIRPINQTDWFYNDKIIAYGNWRSIVLDRLLWLIKPMKNGHKPVGFKDGMIKGALKYGRKWSYFHLDHMPHPIKKSVIAEYFSNHPQHFISNISHKFRSGEQFNTNELYYLSMFDSGKAIMRPSNNNLLYIKPVNRGDKYLTRKMNAYKNDENLKFCCIGSLDMATEKDRSFLLKWLENILNIKF